MIQCVCLFVRIAAQHLRGTRKRGIERRNNIFLLGLTLFYLLFFLIIYQLKYHDLLYQRTFLNRYQLPIYIIDLYIPSTPWLPLFLITLCISRYILSLAKILSSKSLVDIISRFSIYPKSKTSLIFSPFY